MRIGVATVYTPGISGGAEFLADGLVAALGQAGHQVHRILAPFHYGPLDETAKAMTQWLNQDLRPYQGGLIDRLVHLKFPCYLSDHPDAVAWLLHQHRPAYDLFGSPHGFPDDEAGRRLRDEIMAVDQDRLSALPAVFTIAGRVSERLFTLSGVASEPLYHPPDSADLFRCEPAQPYLLVPSRIEPLKRQRLLIEAMAHVKSPFTAVIVGDGGDRGACEALANARDVMGRVRFLGIVSRAHLIRLYAQATAIFFGPFDEDYGYVTLEAMLSSKAVVTCRDSGGPLEFVIDGDTGLVTEPDPLALAQSLDRIFSDPARTARLGKQGFDRYQAMGISWSNVVDRLTKARPEIHTPWLPQAHRAVSG